MSNPSSSNGNPLPTAILVARRATTKPKPKAKPIFDVNLPWGKIAIGATIGFQALLAIMAMFYLARGQRQSLDDNFLDQQQPVRIEKPMAKAELPAVEPKDEEPKAKAAAKHDDFEDAPLFNDEFVDCARIGTNVRFMKEPAAAFQKARLEKKMVFIVHLSGNLEDKEFT